ncbi:MAG: ATP-dependent DNA helicase RecG [Clostridia bacterium]|nr:ATP-dependent DNA helicase RecG [Clostridia bacterium]
MLDKPVSELKGVGAARQTQLNRLGIRTVEDLISHLPRAYHDLTKLQSMEQMHTGEDWFGALTVLSEAKVGYPRRNFSVLRVHAGDENGRVQLVFYNQPYLKQALTVGRRLYVFGRPEHIGGEVRLASPMIEWPENSEGLRMLPIYRTTTGLNQNTLRKLIKMAFEKFGGEIADVLPRSIREENGLFALRDAYELAHFPTDATVRDKAIETLSFTELLLLRLYLSELHNGRGKARPACLGKADKDAYINSLGFTLTGAQNRAIEDIERDMASDRPMSRLLQGDVGSGKTVVAFFALYNAIKNGRQAALMAPTELLAAQHAAGAERILGSLGAKITLLRSGMKAAEKREALRAIREQETDLVIGTHAVIQQGVEFNDLGAVVADEQHRFGVAQRARLMEKGEGAHAIFLSATPIPRTLSMIVYGDLDLSVIDELPPNRKPVQTNIVPPHKREQMLDYLEKTVQQGRQVFIVCPRIEEEEQTEVLTAEQAYDRLRQRPALRAGLLHGRMKAADKEAVMQAFLKNEIGVLISTTVIEVGVDVPNATVMVIENAERFGLAQLHQLRGRVGRGAEQSYCFLCTEDVQNIRLRALCATQNGFEIAQVDLEQRGPGALLGQEQHGRADVRLSSMLRDTRLLDQVLRVMDGLNAPENEAVRNMLIKTAEKRYADPLTDVVMN